MTHAVRVLHAARDDYREIRQYVRRKFGEQVWKDSDQKYKELLHDIGEFPFAGAVPDEALRLGLHGIRQRLLGPSRVIYEIHGQSVYVHMFVSARRDFATMLIDRVLKGA